MDKVTDWRDDHRARTLHLLRKEIDAPNHDSHLVSGRLATYLQEGTGLPRQAEHN